jgi:serine phosphatase RsbU (regulator of sigma subunit)
MSEGIAEAANADGKLFGFERLHELLRKATTEEEVAGAAQAFGQEDRRHLRHSFSCAGIR